MATLKLMLTEEEGGGVTAHAADCPMVKQDQDNKRSVKALDYEEGTQLPDNCVVHSCLRGRRR
jgi:hypothetical protein